MALHTENSYDRLYVQAAVILIPGSGYIGLDMIIREFVIREIRRAV